MAWKPPKLRISKPDFTFSYETKHHLIHMGLIVLGGWLMYQYARTYPQGTVVHWKYFGAALLLQALGAVLVLYVGLNMWGAVRNHLGLRKEHHSRSPRNWETVAVSVGALFFTLLGACLFLATVSHQASQVLLKLHHTSWSDAIATADFHKSGFQSLVVSTGAALLLHFTWTRLVDGTPSQANKEAQFFS